VVSKEPQRNKEENNRFVEKKNIKKTPILIRDFLSHDTG